MSDKTDWFPPRIKPVHKGLYERSVAMCAVMDEWDGKRWFPERIGYSCWRGLKEPPK